ncbi:PIN domain-containing protein [Cyclobacterium sp.]|jgi:predicted nucleic acid-binding protein|uniref:PIN domain-containing protein n=1 Tax=Cyclobacterium sp. TaxID=1966343 RepID=UPI00199502D2|nr:PIN domain-containing protein [Cyclobacterium sp.]MBD3630785.1 hypothetical protein [Cyclobacterium sp.]
MRIAVTDACIFIDLIELDLISDFFQLELQLHTTVDVMNELFQEQKQVLVAYQKVEKLIVHILNEEDFSKMDKMAFPKGLSPEDRSVIYVAFGLENGIVLSSDKLVRKCAERHSLEYHGLFWIFDLLVTNCICSKAKAVSKIQKLLTINTMYASTKTRKEIEVRVRKWS